MKFTQASQKPLRRTDWQSVLPSRLVPKLQLRHRCIGLHVPSSRLAPKLVYSARGSDVVTSIIDGQLVMENRRVLTISEEDVLHRAEGATQDLIVRAGPETAALLAAPWPRSGAAWRASVGRED